MELIVTSGERREKVRVERDGAAATVTIGDRTYHLDAAQLFDDFESLLIEGRQYEVAVRRETPSRYRVLSEGPDEVVEVVDPLTALAESAAAAAGGGRRRREVTAYMPGKVVAVLAKVGDEVRAGQGIVVLEAMKMQNEIQAPNDGVVRRVVVSPGQPVEGGDPLFELE